MTRAKKGNKVKVHYTGTLDDGTMFDSSFSREPMKFTLGEGTVLSGFENAVLGLDEGQKTSVGIAAADAYGEYRDELVMRINRGDLPDEIKPQIGMTLQASAPDGFTSNVTILEIGDDTVTIDANHPLAGKNLNFEIKLVEVL